MRTLPALCFSALLTALTALALAANDRVIVFTPPETQLSQYASGAATAPVSAPAPTRGRYGGGLIEALWPGAVGQPPQTVAPMASEPTSDAEGEPDPQFQRQEVEY